MKRLGSVLTDNTDRYIAFLFYLFGKCMIDFDKFLSCYYYYYFFNVLFCFRPVHDVKILRTSVKD